MASEDFERDMSINAFALVRTHSDLYNLVDAMLAQGLEPLTYRQFECDRSFLAATISIVFDLHELYAHPRRLTNPSWPYFHEVQFGFWATELLNDRHTIEFYDNIIIKQMRDNLTYRHTRRKWVRDRVRHPGWANSLAVAEYKRFKRFRYDEQVESVERCKRLAYQLVYGDYPALIDSLCARCADEMLMAEVY